MEELLPGDMFKKRNAETSIEFEEEAAKEKKKKEYEKNEQTEQKKERNKEIELEESPIEKKRPASNEDEALDLKQKKTDKVEIVFTDDFKLPEKIQVYEEETSKDKKKKQIEVELVNKDDSVSKKQEREKNITNLEDIKKVKTNILEDNDAEKKKAEATGLLIEQDLELKQKDSTDLDLIDSAQKAKKEKTVDAEKEVETSLKTTSIREFEDAGGDEKKLKASHAEEKELKRKEQSKIQLELNDSPQTKKRHESTTEKIDSYLRGGEAKAQEQDWSQKAKGDDVTIKLVSTSQNEVEVKRGPRKDAGEITIDYRMMKEEFNELAKSGYKKESFEEKHFNEKLISEEEDSSFKVVELQANGFDFAVSVVNQYFNLEVRPHEIIKSIAQKILNDEKAYCVFYNFLGFSNEHNEIFNSFKEFQPSQLEYWNEFIKDKANLEYLYSKTMSTWLCREIKETNSFWSENELPSWASQELNNKVVEYIYPYYDGLDRMGMAYLYFPEGIRAQNEKKIVILLELLRGIFLDTIQRTSSHTENKEMKKTDEKNGNVLSLIGSFFNRKKTG